MKNSILTLLAVSTMLACKKSETTTVNQPMDSTAVAPSVDSPAVTADSTTVTGTTNTKVSLSDQDKKFADGAAQGGLMEVMMGKLVATNASDKNVKNLGEMMVKDHSKANEELKSWASTVGYTLPTSLDAEKQKKYDELKSKKGAEFDRMYSDLMVSDHKEDIAEFKKEAADGQEASLKSFASKTLPTLDHHLMEAQKTKSGIK
ncbi:DUF4142 domain-containing protein [Chryseobacterium sp. B21-037]|uniref:DUF4142 domain-containing protein n=1 Tax=Chryseobacterium sp. B21-037 TaxID=2926038 RepID=UPI002359B4EF|nr:DUF4142 domain-containing protein [Chryseobacterium sp. B21-037]MDC8104613.1 DUF4142 domain-containing protein [Chryseobacterium sp. B21-037]